MEYNLSILEIMVRYAIMMVLVILGGIMHSSLVMLLAMPFFLTAILGWCPVYQFMGVNRAGGSQEH